MGRTKEEAPKTYSLRVTEHALQNINSITGYIAYIRHEPLNAIRVGDEIFKIIDRIEKSPFARYTCLVGTTGRAEVRTISGLPPHS